jgi:hypothetical protein
MPNEEKILKIKSLGGKKKKKGADKDSNTLKILTMLQEHAPMTEEDKEIKKKKKKGPKAPY